MNITNKELIAEDIDTALTIIESLNNIEVQEKHQIGHIEAEQKIVLLEYSKASLEYALDKLFGE